MLSKGEEPKTYCVIFLFDTCYCIETLIISKTKNKNEFKTLMIGSNLCKYNDGYIHVKATRVPNTAAAGVLVNNTNKKLIFKNCAPFIYFISRVNNTKVDDAQDIDVVKPMYNLIKYSDTYSKISGSLWQFYRDETPIDNNNNNIDFSDNNDNNISFKFKQQITGQTGNCGTKDIEIMAQLKYLSNFWRTLELSLINLL